MALLDLCYPEAEQRTLMQEKERMALIVDRLEKYFPFEDGDRSDDPFSTLIATILSQNTNDRNSHLAFVRLRERFEITPQNLSQTRPEDIKPSIEVAGLSDVRSRRIVEVSEEVMNRFGGDVTRVFSLPLNEARRKLMDIKGVGPKTADILLCFVGGYAVMPIDTNIFRVADRLGFANGRNYERTRLALERLIPAPKLHRMHLLLIMLGREFCKPRRPFCSRCPATHLCDYGRNQILSQTSR
jgi:endonuclease-3